MNSLPIYIVDEIGRVVTALDVVTYPTIGKHINYMYGHPLEIIARLQALTSSTDMTLRASKYPLVALFQDFKEINGTQDGIFCKTSLNLIIANITTQTFTAEQRYTNNFKTVLYPIYQEFLNQLLLLKYPPVGKINSNTVFEIENEDMIKHTKIDRVYWGKSGLYSNSGNVFNDFLDAIEIQGLELMVNNKYF